MSVFSKQKQAATHGPGMLSYTRSFDSGQAVKTGGEARRRHSPAMNEESAQAEYDVPASGWSEPEYPRTQGLLIEGEYEVSPAGWPSESLSYSDAVGGAEEYEVYAEGELAYAESYRMPASEDGVPDEGEVFSSADDTQEREDGEATVESAAPESRSGTAVTVSGGEGADNEPSAGGKKTPPREAAIDEAMVADDIRSIMMGEAEPPSPPEAAEPPRQVQPVEQPPSAAQSQPASLEESMLPQAPDNARKKMENEHAIFDRIAQSMKYANAYDLGSIALEQRFDAFDEAEDNNPAAETTTDNTAPLRKSEKGDGPETNTSASAQQQEFIEDLDLITRAMAQPDSEKIPLDPGVGGRSIGESALEPGDIILSTTTEDISRLIRDTTDSEVSHSSIYIGTGQVVEAVDSGVILRSLDTALDDDILAVAYRHRDMTEEKAEKVVNFLKQQAVAGRKFDNWGLVRAAPGQLARAVCNRLDGPLRRTCLAGANELKVGTDDQNAFYCSELVLAALKEAALSITDINPSWSSPEQIVDLHLNGLLDYVGHLKV